jgi:hypothetical protein
MMRPLFLGDGATLAGGECRLKKRFYSPDPSPDIRDYLAFAHKSTFFYVAMQYQFNSNPLFTPR